MPRADRPVTETLYLTRQEGERAASPMGLAVMWSGLLPLAKQAMWAVVERAAL